MADGEHEPVQPRRLRIVRVTCALLPAAVTVWMGFEAGGFFPTATGLGAAVMLVALACGALTLDRPWAALAGPWLVLGVGLAAFGGLQLASAGWSGAPGRAALESDRTLLYLAAALAGAFAGPSAQSRRLMVRSLAVAFLALCVAGFVSRTLPEILAPPLTNEPNRLSYPATYWNAMGLIAAFAVVLLFALAADLRERAVVRVLAAATLPLCATTLLLTFSRGGIGLCAIGLLVFAVISRSRGLAGAVLATAAPVAAAVLFALDADALSSGQPRSALAIGEGHELVLAIAACSLVAALLRVAGLPLDARLERLPASTQRQRRSAAGVLAVGCAVAAAVAISSGFVGEQIDRFIDTPPASFEDQRDRLLDVGADGRIELWTVAWNTFEDEPLLGSGAGTYAKAWSRDRSLPGLASDGHSVYLEALAELGIVGGALLAIILLAVAGALVGRTRHAGAQRPPAAALLAAAVMWFVGAAIDWHWEMPVVTVWLLAASGAALSRAQAAPATRAGARRSVLPLVPALACLLLAVQPVRSALSQHRLDQAVASFVAGDCTRASRSALGALSALPGRAEPWEVIAYCDARAGRPDLAQRALSEAERLDPGNWEVAYARAVVLAAAGRDPAPALAAALRANPRSTWAADLRRSTAKADARGRRRAAAAAPLPVDRPGR